MKKTTITLITLLTIISNVKGQPETIWQMYYDGTFSKWAYSGGDEFNGITLDLTKWDECYEWGCDQNGPNGYFKKGSSHHIVDNGILKLVTKYEPGYYEMWHWDANGIFYPTLEHRNYTSGMIVAKQRFKYGLFEIRFKLPVGLGLWPAFWLYGVNSGDPNEDNEEFDIFEYKGETPDRIHINTHLNGNRQPEEWFYANGNFSDSYNTMMGEWGPNFFAWYLNGQEFDFLFRNFNQQAFLIANLGVANNCPAPFCPGPNNTTPLPAYFEIDYIRVWTRLDCSQDINISNYSQGENDPTVITGRNINITNLNLGPGQTLKLIATDEIVFEPNPPTQGNFEVKIVDCPVPVFKKEENSFNQSDSALKIISAINPDSSNENSSIENPSILYTKIFPNPTDGKITIEFEGKIERNIKIELISSAGQIVFSKDNIIEKTLNIDISQLPKGIYILKGVFGNNTISDKIILK